MQKQILTALQRDASVHPSVRSQVLRTGSSSFADDLVCPDVLMFNVPDKLKDEFFLHYLRKFSSVFS